MFGVLYGKLRTTSGKYTWILVGPNSGVEVYANSSVAGDDSICRTHFSETMVTYTLLGKATATLRIYSSYLYGFLCFVN